MTLQNSWFNKDFFKLKNKQMSKYIVCQKEKNDYEVFGQNVSLYREA